MKRISVLDCTLRDGGYCNLWNFSKENIELIISNLTKANIDVIECGFLTKKVDYNKDFSLFDSIGKAEIFIKNRGVSSFALMVNFGEMDIQDIPQYNGGMIDTIRVAFHKKDSVDALKMCKDLCNKGYRVFIQAMVSLSYSEEEFLSLINNVNAIMPYAFYIVDSFGVMKTDTLAHLMNIVDENLNEGIVVGFHSHNNMQLSYANAQLFCSLAEKREIIVDSSIMGMGRGAGNLNTELFTEYLNDKYGKSYVLRPLLQTIDKVINVFYQKNAWGYTLPNYLSAKYNLHPNYSRFLDDKKTLSVKDIDAIFTSFSEDKKFNYDEEYISKLYLEYMSANTVSNNIELLENSVFDKEVVLIAPGKSAELEKQKIIDIVNENVKVVSINHNYNNCKVDYVFISNKRKATDFVKNEEILLITTSNVQLDSSDITIDYKQLLNNQEHVKDNAGLMAIKMLVDLGVKKIYLAGFDGYSSDYSENYSQGKESVIYKKTLVDNLNKGMRVVLSEYSKMTDIEFLTSTKYLGIALDK